jgi:hypothetical protein
MLVRRDAERALVIGQPAHAWVSGQLARAWAGPVEPWEEVCLAAEQHDLGMAAWERQPTLNPETGLPRSFMELPLDEHVEIWRSAAPLVLTQSRYAALLVSMHGTALYERRDLTRLEPGEVARVEAFMAEQHQLQRELIAGLDEEQVRRNQRLIWTWDSLSLGLLLGWAPFVLRDVPAAGEIAVEDGTLDPWPFADERVSVRCDARRLEGRYDDEAKMRAALEAAPWTTVEVELARR